MRRFELKEGTSKKFWEIEVEGSSHSVRYGAIGANGQTKTKDFASPAAATADADKLVREKLKKGYAEIAAQASGPSATPTPTPKGVAGWIARLDAIPDLGSQEDMESFQSLLEELEDAPKKDPALLAALLGVLERAVGQDDFGLFASAECLVDEFPAPVRAQGLRQSIRRCVTWKALELLGDGADDIAALEHALAHQELGGLNEPVRDRLRELGKTDDGSSPASSVASVASVAPVAPVAPLAAAADDAYRILDDGQSIRLRSCTKEAMRRAHDAAPDALQVAVEHPDQMDAETARALLEAFPPLALPPTHPWFEFAHGPCFSAHDGGFSPAVAKVLEARLDRSVSVRRSRNEVAMEYEPVTLERIAAAKRVMPNASGVVFSTEAFHPAIAEALLAAFPKSDFSAKDRGLTPKTMKLLADRLVGIECEAEQVKALIPFPRLRRLALATVFDEEIATEALSHGAKIAAFGTLEELELCSRMAPMLHELAHLPLRRLVVSHAGTAIDRDVVKSIADHDTLRELSLWASLDKAAYAALKQLPKGLERLSCVDGGDQLLVAAGALRSLHALNASTTTVSDSGIEALAGLELQELRLQGKKITDRAAKVLAAMTSLRTLELKGTTLSDAGCAALLARLPALNDLDLEGCKALGDRTFAAAVRSPSIATIKWSGGKPLGREGLAALAGAAPSLRDVLVTDKLGDDAFAEALRYRQSGGKVSVRLRNLSKKQKTLYGD